MPDLRTYDIGTVAVTAAGAVTVTTGIWNDANVQPGDSISIDGGPALLIRSKSDTSHAQIVGWDGGDVSGKSYVVFQNASYRFDDVELGLDLKDQVTALNKINYFIPVQDDEAAPDPSLGDENQRAFKDLTGEWWKKEGGVWVRKSSPYGMQTAPIFSFEGDSLTNTSVHGTWPLLIREQSGFFGRGNHHQFAASGETAATMVGEYASQAGALAIAAEQEAYFFLWAGTNDITAGDSASTIYGNLKTLWVAARTTGYKVVAFTIMPRGDINSTQNDVRIALNALILSDPSLYDFVVRPDVIFSNPADTVNYISDTLHLTDAGNAIIARHVIAAVLGVQTVPAAPFDAMAHSNLVINGACEVAQEAGTGVKTGFVGAASPAYAVDGIQFRRAAALPCPRNKWPMRRPALPTQ